jgi:hypothetical protein
MTRTRLGLLGLCAMVFGLMAFSAAAAQAEVGAQWLLAEKAPGTKLVAFLEAEIGLRKETNGILHSKIAGIAVLFECTELSLVGNPKLKANGSISTGKIKFTGCDTFLNGVLSKPCLPEGGGVADVIETLNLHALIILHKLASGEVDDLLSVLPDDVNGKPSEVFAHIELGPECAIGENVLVVGKATLKDCEGLALTHLVEHLVELGPLTELWVTQNKTAEHVATILGSAWGFLTGAHTGMKFSGDPA